MADGYIRPGAMIGSPPEQRGFEGFGVPPYIHPTARVEAGVTVDAGVASATFIGERTWLMKKVHVGHDAWIGDDCELAPLCSVGGHVTIHKGVRVGQGALFKPYVQVGEGARIGMGAVVICDVPAGEVWAGNPARCIESKQRDLGPLERRGWDTIQLAVQMNEEEPPEPDPEDRNAWVVKNRELREQNIILAKQLWPGAETLTAGDEGMLRPRRRRCLQREPHAQHVWPHPHEDTYCPGVKHAILGFTGIVE